MKRLVLILSLLFGAAFAAPGQQMSAVSLDPEADAKAFAAVRKRMAAIRRTRPTVALVLSGGGAKGAAILGVLKEIEDLDIPVDLITGTSIGGLVGGLYSVGYSADELSELFLTVDWDMILSDKVPPEYMSYSAKQMRQTYNVVTSFYDEINLGRKEEREERTGPSAFSQSIPSGYVQGYNVENLFSSLTVGYQDPIDFIDLPIPFICVATDLVTCKAKNWTSGSLSDALRSTMSVPFLFKPIRRDGMVLVDGGMRNNYPVDIARACGADIVIGVDLSTAKSTYEDINNITDVIMQSIDMLGRDSFEKNVHLPDVTIHPDLEGYNMMSFNSAAIDTIMRRGLDAAKLAEADLRAVKKRVSREGMKLAHAPAVNIAKNKVRISGVEIRGVNQDEASILLEDITFAAGDSVSKRDIETAMAAIYATDAFASVSYELTGTEQPFDLVINCVKGPNHRFALGARMDTEELASLLINVGINAYALSGDKLSLTTKIGSNPMVELRYWNDTPGMATLNADIRVRHSKTNYYHIGEADLDAGFWQLSERFYVSNLNLKSGDVKAGLRHDGFNVNSLKKDEYTTYRYDSYVGKQSFLSMFVEGLRDTFDDRYFPDSGMRVGGEYSLVFAGSNIGSPVHILSAHFSKVWGVGPDVAFVPAVYARGIFSETTPFPLMNMAGGAMAGKYIDQQMPFIGINYIALARDMAMSFDMPVRYNFAPNHYASLHAAVLLQNDDFRELFGKGIQINTGLALEYGYNSFLGPLRVNVHWSDITQRVGAYLSLGFDF